MTGSQNKVSEIYGLFIRLVQTNEFLFSLAHLKIYIDGSGCVVSGHSTIVDWDSFDDAITQLSNYLEKYESSNN